MDLIFWTKSCFLPQCASLLLDLHLPSFRWSPNNESSIPTGENRENLEFFWLHKILCQKTMFWFQHSCISQLFESLAFASKSFTSSRLSDDHWVIIIVISYLLCYDVLDFPWKMKCLLEKSGNHPYGNDLVLCTLKKF